MKYTPQIYQLKDFLGNVHNVEVVLDTGSHIYSVPKRPYVASIRGGRYHRMFDGSLQQYIVVTGEGETPLQAADNAIEEFNKGKPFLD